ESSEDEENVFNQGRISVDIDERIELVNDQEKDAQEDSEVQEVVEVVNAAKLMTEVATTAVSIPIPAAKSAVVTISATKPAAKPKALKIVPAAPNVSTRKRKGVVIRDPEEELHDDTPYIRRYHGYKKKPQSKSEARKNMIAYLKNTEGFKIAFFKGKTYEQIRPIFQARPKENTKCVSAAGEELTAAKHKLKLLV
nr:hypothetical protein [Tanacetum cinerariifolium]